MREINRQTAREKQADKQKKERGKQEDIATGKSFMLLKNTLTIERGVRCMQSGHMKEITSI